MTDTFRDPHRADRITRVQPVALPKCINFFGVGPEPGGWFALPTFRQGSMKKRVRLPLCSEPQSDSWRDETNCDKNQRESHQSGMSIDALFAVGNAELREPLRLNRPSRLRGDCAASRAETK